MGSSLDELRKRIYGSATPDENTVRKVQQKAVEVTPSKTEFTGGTTTRTPWSELSGRLESSISALDSGRKNIENLDALYRKDRSELNRVNYNNAVTRYNQELKRYNSLVTDYEYYTSVDGIKARAEEAKAALKSAQDEYLRIASEGQGARTYGALAGLKTTSGKSTVEAKKAVEEAKANYNKILQEYYAAENSSKKSDLASNASLSKTYTEAKEIESDLDLVVKAMSRGPATTSATGLSSDESAYLQKKYGLSAADLMSAGSTKLPELQQKLSKTLADSKDTLAAAGYQYDRLSEYDQRQQKALEYAATQAEIEEFAKAHSVIASAASVIAAPLQGVDYLRVVLSNAGNSDTGDLDTYVPPNVYDAELVNFVNTTRTAVGEEIAKDLDWEIYGQNVAQFLYQTGMSIADSTAQIALLGPAASLTMGSSAAASTAADIVARGGTSDQAFWGGLAAGAAETVFEKVSIERLLKIQSADTFKQALKAAGWQAVTEGSEETLTEISNILSDAVIMGRDSSFRVAVETYMENDGLTQDEAEKRAFMDCVAQVLWATAGGAISGSTLAGGKLSFGAVSQNRAAAKTGAQVKSGLANGVNTSVFAEIQKGMDAQENSEAHRLAQDAQRQLDEKKRVSNVTLGKLTWANKTLEMTDLQILAETGKDNTSAKEVLQEAAAEYVSSGALTSSTAARVRTVAGQIATGAVTQEQKAAAAEAANPGATVKSPAVTVFTDLGMSLKTAETKAEIVQKLMSGEEVSNRDINKLDPTSAKMRAAFSQITGVQFPEGKLSQEQLYSLYRSAASVKSTADVVAESDISAIQDRVRSGVTAETGPEILQAAMNATAATKPETDAAAARMIAEQLGEIDQNGDPLVSFRDFSNAYRSQVNPTATREELARAYDQYRSDLGTTEFGGNRMTRSQFEAMLREAPGGQNLTSEEIDSLYAMSQSANQNGEDGYDRFSLSGEERSERRILRRIPAERREQVSAEMSRRGELERAAKYMSSVLRDLGIAPDVVVEYGDDNTRLADAYVDADGRIHFNGDKISGAGMMQYILGHELTHTAARITGDTSVTDAVIDAFRKLNSAGVLSGETARWMSDVDGRLDTLLNRYQRHAKSVGDDASRIDRDYVREELAADLMRQVFVSEDLMSRLAGERPSLLMRARNAADRILAKLTRNSELQMVVDARDELRRLGDLFENTLRKSEAESTYRSDHVVETRDGSPVAVSDENGDMKFSLSTYDSEGRDILREWLDVAVERGDLTREDADSITVSLEEIYRVCRDHQKDYAPFDNWSEAKVVTDENGRPVFSVVKANGEYALNLDFSTVCKKRRTLDAVLNELVRSGWASENQIADAQMVKINDIIRDHGFETACALCFVDAKRFRQDKIAANFTEMYNRAVRSLVPENSGIPVNTFDFSGRGTELQESGLETRPDAELDFSGLQKTMSRFGDKTVSHKIANHLMENPEDRKLLDKGDFLSSAGFNVIAREKPEILSLFNAKKGSGGPKSTFGDVQYLNEIISSRSFNAEKAFSVGGVRLQSFSDYVPRMVFDYAQVVSDLSAKRLPAQAYTKEELFVKQFGLTGIKINMSLIPRVESGGIAPGLDSRGNYIWADESFDFNTAVEIQTADGYSRNCGTVAVGISDEHIRTLMADDRIRMIIPYHKSGLNPVVARMNNIAQFKDYTRYQNTRDGNGTKLTESAAREVPDFNQEMRLLGDPRAAAESYVRFCESKGYLPKFDQFAYQQVGGVFVEENGQKVVDPNYYKLLEDFTVYDAGEYVGQEAVQPVYPTEDSAFGSMTDLILRGLDEDAVLEGRRSSEVASIVQEVQDTLGDVRAGTEPRYALPDRDLSFAEQVDMTLSGTLNDVLQGAAHIRGKYGPAESALYVAKEPTALMQEIGFGDLPLVITQQHIRQINARRVDENGTVIDDHNHQLDADTIKSLPDMIASPVAILRAPNRPGSAVIVSDRVDFQGNPIIVPIKSNGLNLVYDGKVGPAHVVTSMYGRENFSRFLTRAVDGGEVLFVDKKRIEPLLLTGGNHRSTLLDGVDSDTILGQITPNVNTQDRRYALPETDRAQNTVDNQEDRTDTVSEVSRVENQFESQERRVRENGETAVLYNPYSRYFKIYVNGNPVPEQNHGFDFDTQQEAQAFLDQNRRYLESYDPTLDPDFMTDAEDFAETVVERNYRRYEQSKTRRTSMQDILSRISNGEYRVYDLYSMAEQLGFEDYEDMSATDLAEDIAGSIQERIDSGDLNMLEAQAPARGLWLRPASSSSENIRYSITPEFEQWYRENYGAGEDITDRQLQRAMQRQERKTQMAEESAQAARTKAAVDAENTLTAWLIYHKKNMRRLSRDLQKKSADQLAELRREKAQAIREVTELERAKAAVQHDADVMAFKRQAAARLRVKDGQYTELKEKTREQTRLKRKAAERALKDSRQAAKKRAELETKNGMVKTIREIPGEKRRIEKLQEQAANLKTLWRPAYSAFVNQAKAIDDFAKRQSGGTLSSTLVNVLGGSSTTIESVFKRGLVDRSGNRIGDAMKDVFLIWDGKKVDEAKQALLQDYMLHAHNVDRMSFVKNARARLEAFELENPWLRDMDQKEFAKLVAMTESEIEKTGKKKAHDLAVQYAQLLDQYNRSQDKPIFADTDGNAVTADTSRAIVKQYLAENPWLEEKAQGIYDWWDQFMRTWAVGDSLTLEQYETMREIYPHYVPTYRADKKGVGSANFVGAGGATIGTAVKKAKGGLSEVVNIEDSFANLANKIIKLARTNELYKNIIDTALLEDGADSNVADMAVFDWDSVSMGSSYKTENGEIVATFSNGFDMSDHVDEAERPGLLKTKDGYKLSAWYDGQLLSAYVSEDLYKSIARVTGSDANDFSRAFLRVGNALTGPMKTAITGINPAFAMRNISRDLPTAVVNSISGAAFLKYYGRALTEMRRNSDNWQVFQALGGTHAGYYNNNKGFAGAMSQRDNILAKTGAALGRFNDITEAQTRFAEYLATIDRLGDTYENRLLGIKNAAEVTVDFSRKGWIGKYINAWVPYWNPAVQGIDKVVRSLVDSPDGSKIWKQASRTLGRAALGTVLLEAVLQVVLTALGRRDEWEQLDDRTKDTYYCIPLADSYTFLKIPKNREWGAILGTPFMRMLEWANGRDDPFENYLETSIIPNFLPPLPSDTVGFSQWNDLSTNEDFAGRAIVPYAYEQGSLTEQYDAETSLVSKAIAQLLNFSPMQLDYIITDYFGDFGEMYQKATAPGTWSGDSGVAELGKSVADIFFGGFEADARYSNAAVSKYYDTMDRLSQVVQDKKNHVGTEAAKKTIEYQTQSAINKLYGNAITDLNTEVRNLPDGEEKDALKAQIVSLAAEAMDFYEQSMAGNVEAPVLQAEYDEYDSSVRNELIDLDDYSSEYKFKPTGNASSTYTDPENSDREFILTEDQKDRFHEIYVEQYNEMVGDLIRQNQYRSATGEKRAELLEDLRDDVLDETKKEFFRWLDQTGVRSTLKTR